MTKFEVLVNRLLKENISIGGNNTRWIDGDIEISLHDVNEYLSNEPLIDIKIDDIKDLLIKVNRDPKRVDNADLKYPIIVTMENGDYKKVLDGQHRVVKSIKNNKDTIKGKVLNLDNAPDDYVYMFS